MKKTWSAEAKENNKFIRNSQGNNSKIEFESMLKNKKREADASLS
jgi:hypothetical protein